MTEPMEDVERIRAQWVDDLRTAVTTHKRDKHMQVSPLSIACLFKALDAERSRADAAEVARDAALARARADWQPIETAPHGVLVLLYCPDHGPTNPERIELGYARWGRRNAVSSSISQHAWATMWHPLPDLLIPTNGDAP